LDNLELHARGDTLNLL